MIKSYYIIGDLLEKIEDIILDIMDLFDISYVFLLIYYNLFMLGIEK